MTKGTACALTILACCSVAAASGCEERERRASDMQDAGTLCGYEPCDCRVEASAFVPARVETATLIVRGTARHLDGLAILRVIVAATEVTQKTHNFATWEVTLDRVSLDALPPTAADEAIDGGAAPARVQLPIAVVGVDGRTCVQRHPVELELALPAS